MNKEQLLRFARAFELCPGLLPRVEILQLFQCALDAGGTTGKQVRDALSREGGEGVGYWGHPGNGTIETEPGASVHLASTPP